MENFKDYNIPEFEDQFLSGLVKGLQGAFSARQDNFALTCFFVKQIHKYCKGRYIQSKDGYSYNSFGLLEKFGFNKKSVNRLEKCFDIFCYGNRVTSIGIHSWAQGFSPSKLFEMLPLSKEIIMQAIFKKVVFPDMTVKEIRLAVKDMLGKNEEEDKTGGELEVEEINEEEIPEAYDPVKEYDFEYFKSQSKNQLLNMIWELQKAYQKLKKRKK